MAKLKDKLYNRVIEGELKLSEEEIGEIANPDILSKIKMEYSEDDDLTYITFPKGIVPLSITFGVETLFFKGRRFVNDCGIEPGGYDIDDYYSQNDHLEIDVNGDITEQLITGMTYVKHDSDYIRPVSDSLILFNPSLYSGTKLYRHNIRLAEDEYDFNFIIVINNVSTQILTKTALISSYSAFVGGNLGIQGTVVLALSTDETSIMCYIMDGPDIATYTIPNSFVSDTVTEL